MSQDSRAAARHLKEIRGRKSNQRSPWVLALLISLVVIGALAVPFYRPVSTYIRAINAPPAEHVNRVSLEFLRARQDQPWLPIGFRLQNMDVSQVRVEQSLAKQVRSLTEASLVQYSAIPAVAELRKLFGAGFMVTVYDAQMDATRIVATDSASSTKPDLSKTELVIFGRPVDGRPRTAPLLSYNAEWKALMVGGIQWSDGVWFSAIALHEIYHAGEDRLNRPGAHAQKLSKPWVDEEVAAHSIERDVLDLGTSGRYRAALDSIVRGKGQRRNLNNFIASVSVGDLNALDAMFQRSTTREAGVRGVQYFLDLAHRWLEINETSKAGERFGQFYADLFRQQEELSHKDRR